MGYWFLMTAVALALVLYGEKSGKSPLVWIFKPVASAGFIGAAVAAGAFETAYGHAIFMALVWSMAGDILLIPRNNRTIFTFGLVAFLIGHLGYVVAFKVRGLDMTWAAISAVGVVIVAWVVWRWLRPHLPKKMVGPVIAYITVISLMVVAAFAAFGAKPHWVLLVAALMFYVSDLLVARQRFVAQTIVNRVIGLPIYYGAQCLFAASVAWAV